MPKALPTYSVVVPTFNEEGNLPLLHQKLTDAMRSLAEPYELIFINDGSTDRSGDILDEIACGDPFTQVIHFQQNFGKTAGLTAGFRHSRGQIIITLDADLQDDPAEIPKLLSRLRDGYDLVTAWRYDRNDPADKRLPSRVFNWAVATFTGIRLHDFNSGFKMYRRQVTEQIVLYSDFHRFTPVLAANKGFRVAEVPVEHQPRYSGVSKYGTGRTVRGFFDFVVVLFLIAYLKHPMRLFGAGGLLMFTVGAVIEIYLAIVWFQRELGFIEADPIGPRPLFLVGILAIISGIQLFSIGLLGEMLRYFTFRPDQEYVIKNVVQHEAPDEA